MVVKKEQAILLLKYVELRISKGAFQGKTNVGYGKEECEIALQLRDLNKKGISQAIRKTPDRIIITSGEDMVGHAVKAA